MARAQKLQEFIFEQEKGNEKGEVSFEKARKMPPNIFYRLANTS